MLARHPEEHRSATPRHRQENLGQDPSPDSRHVPVAVRNEVWQRDGGQCAFVGSTGRRCSSRHQLELHHLHPFALGGPSTAANLSLRCRTHNRHAAEQDYGPDHIAQKVAASRRAPNPPGPESFDRGGVSDQCW